MLCKVMLCRQQLIVHIRKTVDVNLQASFQLWQGMSCMCCHSMLIAIDVVVLDCRCHIHIRRFRSPLQTPELLQPPPLEMKTPAMATGCIMNPGVGELYQRVW